MTVFNGSTNVLMLARRRCIESCVCMHVHHNSQLVVKLILPLSPSLSLSGRREAWGWEGRAASEGHTWVGCELWDYRAALVAKQLWSGQPDTKSAQQGWARASLGLWCAWVMELEFSQNMSPVTPWIFVFMSKWTYSLVYVNRTWCLGDNYKCAGTCENMLKPLLQVGNGKQQS